MPDVDENPYVGPRPFEQSDRGFFFGRDSEIRELLSLVVAERVVLLYAASGAGKTSLLQAGLVPLLEEEEGFEVFPVARVRAAVPEETLATARNVYTLGALAAWGGEEAEAEAEAEQPSLAEILARRPHPLDPSGFAAPRGLIFDQFEELFTAHPSYWRQREAFFVELAEALDTDPLLRVVLAIREDYVAGLDPYASLLHGDLRTRFRLERLGAENALGAVVNPVKGTRRHYAPGVAEKLVSDLLSFRVDTGRGVPVEVEGEFVEPVQLQVSCQSLWDELPPEVDEITDEHLRTFGDVDEVLRRFYDAAVAAAAAKAHVRERRLRSSIEDAFITSVGTRNTIYRSADTTATLPNAAIDELENRHLIRAEFRAGARWYELTHDRFITPIQTSNARFRARLARRRLRFALSGVGVLLAALVVGLSALALTSGGGEDGVGAAAPEAEVELDVSPQYTPNTPLDSFRSQPTRLPPDRRTQMGIVYQVRIASLGYGRRFAVTARMFARKNDALVRTLAVGASLPPQTREKSTLIWIRQPQARGTYYTVFTAQSLDAAGPPAAERTQAFQVGDDGRVLENFTLQISVSGPGRVIRFPSGASCAKRCAVAFSAGTSASLKAVADAGASFVGWHGACTGTNPTCSVSGEGRRKVEAEFGAWVTRAHVLGKSVEGRRIVAQEVRSPRGRRGRNVLVIACVHGDECAGIPIAERLARTRPPAGVTLWIVPNLNPDGYASGTRQNADGVDLNRNFDAQWASGTSQTSSDEYRGPRPFSEPETRIVRDLILRLRPSTTVWYYARTPGGRKADPGVAPSNGSNPVERRYLKVVGKPYGPLPGSGPGRGTDWQNAQFPHGRAFFVELPVKKLSPAGIRRHVRAVLAVAAMKPAGS